MIKRPRVIYLVDGSFLIRSWVSRDEAEAIIQREHDPCFELGDWPVEQTYMRAIPAPHCPDYDIRYEHSEPGRGAFACTAIWAD
jgi:hypothetical protein